ncbi:MFS general substrate transporter [Microthyrium microscopicum]|uniref:MFS general substrate transporter n=1 Tax=Microthyrium microscopicum TaxID=703497 RepID=A0A6A6UNE5_9PEZI|nr:MFS general substrate transporter [Microthyrium microscopicum]
MQKQSPKNYPESVASSIHAYEKVPRHLRRGLLGRFSLVPETPTPIYYPRSTKWLITATVALGAAAAPMGSASIMPALPDVQREFGVSATETNLAVALYMLSMSIFPLWWSTFSEIFGRRTIYVISFLFFDLFAILSAVSKNMPMLIVMRMLSGGGAASVQAVGAGTIADIWEPKERGKAMGIYYLGPLCGPLIAPIIGGALTNSFGWRSTQWFLVAWGGAITIGLVFMLPETLTARKALPGTSEVREIDKELGEGNKTSALSRVVSTHSVKNKSRSFTKVVKSCIIDPLKIIALLRFPAVFLTVFYASITFGSLYTLNISIESTFSKPPYNYSTLIVGLLYLPNSVGYFFGSIFGGRWLDHIMKREARKAGRIDDKGKLILLPEDRMRENAWLAGIVFPAALIWYGWSAEKGVNLAVPMVANFFFGLGSMMIFAMATTMLTEFMTRKASTGIAVNNFVRNIFSCVGGVVAAPLINAIGNGWLFTILGLVALVTGFVTIFLMKKYGPRWRKVMDEKLLDF